MSMMFLAAPFILLCSFLPLAHSVIATTKYGKLEGFTASFPSLPIHLQFHSVDKFLGVPFAAPPTEENRLRKPQPLEGWKPKIRQAKKHGSACMQPQRFAFYFDRYGYNITYSEDCLFLDVYTPNVSLSLPVIIYIHGGAYTGGHSVAFPSDILVLHGVVVVVIQYRLGPFGFFTTEDSAAPGNLGLLDQVAALKWVKENIENFGGDPNKITLLGESAGGSSVNFHMMSPLSKDLFHQAIAESGVDLCPWAIQPSSYGIRFAKELAQKLHCTSSDHHAMVECIRKVKAMDIQKAAGDIFISPAHDFYRWSAVVDGHFLTDTPWNLRKKRKFKKVPLMISFNSHEGATSIRSLVGTAGLENGVNRSLFKDALSGFVKGRNKR